MFGPERDEVTRGWRKLHDEELNSLYSSPHIIRMIISKRMGWAGHIACIGDMRMHTKLFWRALKEETTQKT
jgi:hypothetical protein